MKKCIIIIVLLSLTCINGKERKKDKMEMMMAWRLTEHLKLTNEQAEKFFPLFREYREKIKSLSQKEKSLNKELREKIDRGDTISNSELEKLLSSISELEQNKLNSKKSVISNLEGKLNNLQRAKMIGFEHRFRKEVRDEIKDHKKGWKKQKKHSKKNNHFWK